MIWDDGNYWGLKCCILLYLQEIIVPSA